MTHILLNLADILDEACAKVEEQRGQPLSYDIEEMIAHRTAQCAKGEERDHNRLLAVALEGLASDEFSLNRLLLN